MADSNSQLDARVSAETDERGEVEQYLTFIMDDEEYGVEILSVQEIRGWEPTTAIPNSPNYMKGVINLRGTIVPIVDLRLRFGLPVKEYSPITVVIVLKIQFEGRERIVGIVVDAVSDVYSLSNRQLKEAPDVGEHINASFIKGLVDVDDKMIILLDLSKLLDLQTIAESVTKHGAKALAE